MSLARKILATGAAMGALCVFAAPALAGTVIASSGPSASQYRVGAQIANTQRVTLRDNDSVTVLDNGGTRVLRGPGTFVLARRGAQTTNAAFAALTEQRSAGRARVASVRAGDAPKSNPNLWYVDVARSGTVCLYDPARVRLWRGDTEAEAIFAVSAPGEQPSQITFRASEGVAAWDAANPPREGVAYGIGDAQVTFKFLADVPEDAEAMAQTLIEHGCTLQLEQLANATLEEPA